MGLILPQEVEIKLTGKTSIYYENKGYKIYRKFDKKHQKFTVPNGSSMRVNVLDLKPNSNYEVNVTCDCCGKKMFMQYYVFNKYVRENNVYYCTNCGCINEPYLLRLEREKHSNAQRLINDLKNYIENHGYPSGMKSDFIKSNNLSSCATYKKYFGGCLVDWIELCGYNLSEDERFSMMLNCEQISYTKEEVIEKVRDMQSHINRPLKYDDFRTPTKDNVGITYIKKYFGTFNKMKKELGLTIIQENMMDKSPTKDLLIVECEKIKNYIISQGRNFITTREINANANFLSYTCLNKACKKFFNITLVEYMNDIGIRFPKPGEGLSHAFPDGERTTSQYEYMFSNYLRNIGLKYDIDYYRDVKYSSFDREYNGSMNCDYVIKYNDKTIYIEIAGILRDYKQFYYKNIEICNSKSKEKYRVKLKKKEIIFNKNNYDYFILFPCDLTKDNLFNILNHPTQELRNEISKRNKTGIDWGKILDIGELKYKDTLGKDFQQNVDYEKVI